MSFQAGRSTLSNATLASTADTFAGHSVRATGKQPVSIISLSKLREYMPHNQATNKLLQARSNARGPPTAPAVYYRGDLETDFTDQSSYQHFDYSNHEKLARAKAPLGLRSDQFTSIFPYSVSPTSGHFKQQTDKTDTSTPCTTIRQIHARDGRKLGEEYKAFPVAQRELGAVRSSSSLLAVAAPAEQIPAGQQGCSFNSATLATSKSFRGVEPDEAKPQEHHSSLAEAKEERKGKKTDSAVSVQTRGDQQSGYTKEKPSDRRSRNRELRSGLTNPKNNMTPSSLLLLQNHNYIGEQQQQRNAIDYNGNDRNQQEHCNDLSLNQARIVSVGNFSSRDAATGVDAEKSNDNHQQHQHCNDSTLSSSSSSLMIDANTNQFKALERDDGNPSTDTSSNNLTAPSSANIIDTSGYPRNSDVGTISNHQNEVNSVVPTASSISDIQHHYQQSDFKASALNGSNFVHYSSSGSRLSNNHYHANFQVSVLEQQMRFENALNNRQIFEENAIVSDNTILPSGSGTILTPRDLASQQSRVNNNSYYNEQYNLMPTPSSKSASPLSSTSTPSPKTNAMNSQTSQHSNQVTASAGSNTPSQNHVDHHQYINSGFGHQQHQHQHQHQHHINQHYSYNQPATSFTPNQYHLSMPAHEAPYVHPSQPAQQLQHLSHQQLHQQSDLQQQNHSQLHQTHQIQNPQSIHHQLTSKEPSVNHIYCNQPNNASYQNQLQGNLGVHQSNHLISGTHQSHLNSAAAACAAAAVVSQTLKTVANQQNQSHPYGSSIGNGFGSSPNNLMNITTQQHHHHQFHNINSINHHHSNNQASTTQHQQSNLPIQHAASIVTRKYQCKMCPQVFMSKAEMKYHNQNHMREAKPYKCLQCPKAFANSSYLSQHMRIHQGVKPYTCDICARKFTQLSHLQQHKRTHTGDKPYKCNYMNCTKQFSQLSNLQSHSRCHQLDKPYKCNSCYKCFHDEQSLLEHIPRHLESKHLKKNLCIFCGSSYQQERGLVKHFQQYHTDKKPTLVAAAIAAGTTGNTGLIASLVSSNSSSAFATPSGGSGSSSSSSSSSSLCSSGSFSVHNNIATTHAAPAAAFSANQY